MPMQMFQEEHLGILTMVMEKGLIYSVAMAEMIILMVAMAGTSQYLAIYDLIIKSLKPHMRHIK